MRFARNRKPKRSDIRNAVKKQLGYVRRDLSIVAGMIKAGGRLGRRQQEMLKTIETLYEQQAKMHREKSHQAENRIVSLHQSWVRPIVRGKANAVEGKFGEGKRRYYLERTMTRLKETTETQIHLTFLVMNLSKKLRASLRLILDMIKKAIFNEKGLLMGNFV